ncbi:MAG TPA: endolytic transglycosylase MltG [Dissulfurispiraceae bacterium]|nr:endolytic transglycosylase MltG [Dissulfurispiraceae bacterium]
MIKTLVHLVIAGVFFCGAFIGYQLLVPTKDDTAEVEVQIPEGTAFREAVSILAGNGLIRSETLFIVIGRVSGIDKRIRAGFYVFSGRVTPYDVLMKLRLGKVLEYEITVVEGDSLLEIGKKLADAKLMSPETFRELAYGKAFLKDLDIDSRSIEGYLFPQTYRFSKGAKPASVLRVMVQKLREEFTEELEKRTVQMGWSENEVLTLASIIEKEAVVDNERTIISAVYHNRLSKGMPLQADPTSIYGVKSSRQRITRNDLRRQTEYNTYIIRGLPPGPIASPGIKSIKAALYPAKVPYIYFVAKNDRSHYFSRTLAEHNAAVASVRAGKQLLQRELPEGVAGAEAPNGSGKENGKEK